MEQIGTDSDCVSLNGRKTSVPTYYAWFEFFSAGSFLISWNNGVVQFGDSITASVSYSSTPVKTGRHGRGGSGSLFTVTLTDHGSSANGAKNLTFTTSSTVNSAQRSSAEWIAEAPCCGSGTNPLALADFTSVNFSSVDMNGAPVALTLNPTGVVQQIDMTEESNPGIVKAEPVAASGAGFTVNWLNAGP